MSATPVVAVLLATYNSHPWLEEQLSSIAAQRGVRAVVTASDDLSTDGTLQILERDRTSLSVHVLPACPRRMGNANRNFLRLIRDVKLGKDVAYVALSDHDDIWLEDKLARAVEVLRASSCDAYSSNVTAFWPDGREKLLVKSGVQKRYDYLFESAGPGCTFTWPRDRFLELQRWVTDEFDSLQDVKVHDWLIYAWARRQGWRWHIDAESHMRYRQHGRNELGANVGWHSGLARWAQICDGRYRCDVLAVAQAVKDVSPVRACLNRLHWTDRLHLVGMAGQCRRRPHEAILWALSCLLMKRRDG